MNSLSIKSIKLSDIVESLKTFGYNFDNIFMHFMQIVSEMQNLMHFTHIVCPFASHTALNSYLFYHVISFSYQKNSFNIQKFSLN